MRVLLTSPPLTGHVHPLVPFGRAFQDAGHDVTLLSGAAMDASLASTGLATVPIAPDEVGAPQPDVVAELAQFTTWARTFAPILLEHCREQRPDVLVHDMLDFAGPAVAERLGIPAVAHACTFRPPRPLQQAGWSEGWAALRDDLGLPPDADLTAMWRTLYLDPVPPSLYPPPMGPLPTARALRPSVFDRSGDEGLPDEVADLPARPTVYATLGTVFNDPRLLRTVLAALADEDINVVMTTGRDLEPDALGPIPGNAVVRRYIPQSLLLSAVDAVVTHTGFNTVVTALAHALPMVCLPLGADHPMSAPRLAELGAGVNCADAPGVARHGRIDPQRLPAPVVRDAVRRVLSDDSYGDAARKLRDEIDGMPSAHDAVTLVEGLVAEGRVPD